MSQKSELANSQALASVWLVWVVIMTTVHTCQLLEVESQDRDASSLNAASYPDTLYLPCPHMAIWYYTLIFWHSLEVPYALDLSLHVSGTSFCQLLYWELGLENWGYYYTISILGIFQIFRWRLETAYAKTLIATVYRRVWSASSEKYWELKTICIWGNRPMKQPCRQQRWVWWLTCREKTITEHQFGCYTILTVSINAHGDYDLIKIPARRAPQRSPYFMKYKIYKPQTFSEQKHELHLLNPSLLNAWFRCQGTSQHIGLVVQSVAETENNKIAEETE